MVNLFWLSPPRYVRGRGLNYSWCARQHIDAHIIKIPLEAAQLLYGAHHALPTGDDWRTRAPMAGTGERGYKPTHMNNPISKWLRESAAHYRHAVAYGLALCEEYSHRYGREHACEAHLHWLKINEPAIPDVNDHPDDDEVDRFKIARAPPCAMPDEFKVAPPEDVEADVKEEGVDTSAVDDANLPEEQTQGKSMHAGATDEPEGDEAMIIREAELAKEKHTAVSASIKEEAEMETRVFTKVEVELGETSQSDITIKTETSEASETTTTVATDAEEERVENLLLPIEEEVSESEVAFPLHVYQSYRAYYLGQKLSLKMSTFKTRDVPHWAQERVLEIKALPKPTPATKKKSVSTRTRRTTTTAVKRKREPVVKSEDEGKEQEADEDYIENRRLTRSRSRARKLEQEGERVEAADEDDEAQEPKKIGKKRKAVKPEPVEEPTKEKVAATTRRSPRASSAVRSTQEDAALSKRRRVAKELK